MSLSPAGLAKLIAEVAPGATIRRVREVGGGLATETYGIDTTAGDLIVKRYRPGDDTVNLEWARLRFAQRVDLPVPTPLAVDPAGEWFESAVLVMTRLPGGPYVRPTDVDGWLRQLAAALATIHAADVKDANGPLLRPLRTGEWQPPTGLAASALVDRAVAAIRRQPPSEPTDRVLLHADFHPGNTVWHRGVLSGVVDWSAARLGPRVHDLAYCRADVALLLGYRAADRLAHYYGEITGSVPAELPVYDLIGVLEARRWGARWLGAYRQQGLTDTPRNFAARLTPFLRRALAELGG